MAKRIFRMIGLMVALTPIAFVLGFGFKEGIVQGVGLAIFLATLDD